MSYPIDLDEYSWADLQAEMQRRSKDNAYGKCDYCGADFGSKPICKFPGRHGYTTPKPKARRGRK